MALSSAILALSMLYLSRFSENIVYNKVSQDFHHAIEISQMALNAKFDSLNDSLNSALSDPVFRSELSKAQNSDDDFGLGTTQTSGIEESHRVFKSASLPIFVKYPIMALLNSQGTLIYSKNSPSSFGDKWSDFSIFTDIKINETFLKIISPKDAELIKMGLLKSDDNNKSPILLMGLPLRTTTNLMGVLIVGEALDQEVFPQIKAVSEADIYVETNSHGFISERNIKIPDIYLHTNIDSNIRSINEFNNRTLSARIPLNSPGTSSPFSYAILIKNIQEEMNKIRTGLQMALLKIFIIAIIISLGISLLISKKVTRALKNLIDGVKRVQLGDLEFKLKSFSTDEFGQLTLAFNEMTLGLRQKELLKSSLEKYVGSPVMNQIIESDKSPVLSSERKKVTVFFSDIKGFTEYVEDTDPIKVLSGLNEYFSLVTNEIKSHGGIIDKFVGDAVMALWSQSETSPQPEFKACLASLKIQQQLALRNGDFKWSTRMGMSTGECIVGNIGSQERLQFTAIGDTVNSAARLESLNKFFNTSIIVEAATRDSCSNTSLIFRDLGEVKLKGKSNNMRVFELVGEKQNLKESDLYFIEIFNNGMNSYLNNQILEAAETFKKALDARPEDDAAHYYFNQVVDLIEKKERLHRILSFD